jgi:hypothetical protein
MQECTLCGVWRTRMGARKPTVCWGWWQRTHKPGATNDLFRIIGTPRGGIERPPSSPRTLVRYCSAHLVR